MPNFTQKLEFNREGAKIVSLNNRLAKPLKVWGSYHGY